jgi:hypothetical protein
VLDAYADHSSPDANDSLLIISVMPETYNLVMSTAPTATNRLAETDLLVKFEIDNIPDDYREYYGTKRQNFFASIQGFREMWDLYLRLDAIWLRGIKDLYVATDPNTMFPLLLYINAHAKIRVAMELAFAGCLAEARSILRDAVEFVAHAHAMVGDPELQKVWLSKNDDKAALEAFKDAFERHKKDGLFKGLDELHKVCLGSAPLTSSPLHTVKKLFLVVTTKTISAPGSHVVGGHPQAESRWLGLLLIGSTEQRNGPKLSGNDVRKTARNHCRGDLIKIGLFNFELGVRNG